LEKVRVISRSNTDEITRLLRKEFIIVRKNPDFIVSYGGDGTILFSERIFPEIPKLIVKKSRIFRKYDYTLENLEKILTKIKEGEYILKKEMKLETELGEKRLTGLNEIQIHTKLPIHAIRFSLYVNEKEFEELIGDGVIFATPFGSTGYYKSTGGKKFNKGIGISFNNLYNKKIRTIVVSEDSTIKIKINRGPAGVFADNFERFFELKENDGIDIKKSGSVANFIYIPKKK
jgi:NAD+ kinase